MDVCGHQEVLQNSFEVHNSADAAKSSVVCFSAKTYNQKREWVQTIKRLHRDCVMEKMNMG